MYDYYLQSTQQTDILRIRTSWCLYKEVYLQIFKRVSFWLHDCCGEWEGWARKPG